MRIRHIFMLGLIGVVGVVGGLTLHPIGSAQILTFKSAGPAQNTVSEVLGVRRCEQPPTWGNMIRGTRRWVSKWEGAAYCDRQTGVVWEAVPQGVVTEWKRAREVCLDDTVGTSGQKGWRLPSIAELASLVDISSELCADDGQCLPEGHPFQNVSPDGHWSVSLDAGESGRAWIVSFGNGAIVSVPQTIERQVWCVRGPMNGGTY